MRLAKEKIFPIIMNALKEDIGPCDITSELVFEDDIEITADIVAGEDCVLAGIDVAKWVFNSINEKMVFTIVCKDGDTLHKGKRVFSLKGPAKNILAGERTALNFLGRLSGIATLTNRFVEEVKGTKVKIYDTRKTVPGLRELEKYAVKVGRGFNHRIGLWDGVLIKDSHIDSLLALINSSRSQAIKYAVQKAKEKRYRNIEVEVDNLEEFKMAVESGADIIMLDNMAIEDIKKAFKLRESMSISGYPKPLLEVSGGVTIETVAEIANTGVDRISIGSLTHSAPSIDFSLVIEKHQEVISGYKKI